MVPKKITQKAPSVSITFEVMMLLTSFLTHSDYYLYVLRDEYFILSHEKN